MSEKKESWKKLPLRVIGRNSSQNLWREISSPVESSSLQTRFDSSVMSGFVLSVVLTFPCFSTPQTSSLMHSFEMSISTDRGWTLLTVGTSLARLGMFMLSFFIVSQIGFREQLDSSLVFSTELASFLSEVLEADELSASSSLMGTTVVFWWDWSSCWNRRGKWVRIACSWLQFDFVSLICEYDWYRMMCLPFSGQL